MNKASSGGVLAIQLLFAWPLQLSLHYLVAQGRDLSLVEEKKSNISSNTNQIENSGQPLHLCMCVYLCVCVCVCECWGGWYNAASLASREACFAESRDFDVESWRRFKAHTHSSGMCLGLWKNNNSSYKYPSSLFYQLIWVEEAACCAWRFRRFFPQRCFVLSSRGSPKQSHIRWF